MADNQPYQRQHPDRRLEKLPSLQESPPMNRIPTPPGIVLDENGNPIVPPTPPNNMGSGQGYPSQTGQITPPANMIPTPVNSGEMPPIRSVPTGYTVPSRSVLPPSRNEYKTQIAPPQQDEFDIAAQDLKRQYIQDQAGPRNWQNYDVKREAENNRIRWNRANSQGDNWNEVWTPEAKKARDEAATQKRLQERQKMVEESKGNAEELKKQGIVTRGGGMVSSLGDLGRLFRNGG